MVARLFEPLGWSVDVGVPPLDPAGAVVGTGALRRRAADRRPTVAEALRHLYVLLPALDGGKHYFVGPDEVDKLVRAAGRVAGRAPGARLDPAPDAGAPARVRGRTPWQRLARGGRVGASTDGAGAPADARARGDAPVAGRRSSRRRAGGAARGPARGPSSTSGAGRARCCGRCSRTRRSRAWSASTCRVAALRTGGGRARPDARHGARPADAAAVVGDLPRRPAGRGRRDGAHGGDRARRPRTGCRRSSGRCSARRGRGRSS